MENTFITQSTTPFVTSTLGFPDELDTDIVDLEQPEADYEEPSRPEEVESFLESYFPAGLIYANAAFHAYTNGYWKRLDEQTEIRRKIVEHHGDEAKEGKTRNLLALLRDFLARTEKEVEPDRNLICLRNGTFNATTFALIPHSPEHWLRNSLYIDWNPSATCPRWHQFLDEIFVTDADRAQKIAFIQQWFGYCLVPDNSLHKFLWMIGGGGNGKSALLKVLTALVGPENVNHAHLEQLGKTFVRAELESKLLNISPEISTNAKMADGYLKQIVAGDVVEAERKFKPSFSFRPYVRLIAAANQLPRLTDTSEGFYRRAIILKFNRKFTEAEQDPTLEHTLLAELPGILAWAVDGLRSLRHHGHFTIPDSSKAALDQYRVESDAEKLFADACLTPVTRGGKRPADIYAAYITWCKALGLRVKDIIGFGKRLAEMGFEYRMSSGKKHWLVSINMADGINWTH
jgi:putative DNA primase/helicase